MAVERNVENAQTRPGPVPVSGGARVLPPDCVFLPLAFPTWNGPRPVTFATQDSASSSGTRTARRTCSPISAVAPGVRPAPWDPGSRTRRTRLPPSTRFLGRRRRLTLRWAAGIREEGTGLRGDRSSAAPRRPSSRGGARRDASGTGLAVRALNTACPTTALEKWATITTIHQQNGRRRRKANGSQGTQKPAAVGITVRSTSQVRLALRETMRRVGVSGGASSSATVRAADAGVVGLPRRFTNRRTVVRARCRPARASMVAIRRVPSLGRWPRFYPRSPARTPGTG